jgi:type I restriction enzyme S subunit
MKAGWQMKKLGELLQIQNGYAFDSKNFSPSGEMPLIRIRDLKVGIETETKFTGNYDEKYVVRSGDFLIGMDGEFGCYEWKGNPALLNQRVCRLQNFDSTLLPRFLFYGVNSHLKEIEDVTGFTTVKHISSRQILDIDFLSPPLPEQQRIVGILDEAFDGIATAKANTEKNLQNARALFESHLQSVFTQRGEGLVETTLGEVCEFIGGSQPPKSVFSKTKTLDNIRLIQIRDYKSDKHVVYIPRAQARRFCNADDVMIGRYGPPLFQILRGLEGAYNVALMKAVPDESKLSRDFLFYFLKHSTILEYVIYHSERAAGQIGLTKETLAPYPIALPSLVDQQKVVETITELESETQRLESLYQRKLAALNELKKSLLHQAFSGEL